MRAAVAAVALLALVAGSARAQTGQELVAQGLRSYRALEYDAAAALLRRGLAATGTGAVADSDRAGVLVYLGATEIFRNRRDSATTAFRQALQANPRHRPDPLVFPPEVANAYDAVRRTTTYIAVRVAPDTAIIVGDQLYTARLLASALHDIAVDVLQEDGRPVRRLYAGPIGDSLDVRWDGLDSTSHTPVEGRLVLQVVSRGATGARGRTVRLPLATRTEREDTLPLPSALPDSTLLPERTPRGPALRSLGAGLAIGTMAIVLPSLIAEDGEGAGGRFVVAGAVSIAGVVGYLRARPGQPIPDNVAANQAVRNAWQRDLARAQAENARRKSDIHLRITAGHQRAIDG